MDNFHNKENFVWFLTLFIILIIVGASYGLGVDYILYSRTFESLSQYSFYEFIRLFYKDEFLFYFPAWLCSVNSIDFSLVTFYTTFIILYGVNKLSQIFELPFICLILSLYLVIVIGINYPRQAASIGIFCLILYEILKKNHQIVWLKLIFLFFIAINFHKSSILLLLIFISIYFTYDPFKNILLKILFLLMFFLISLIFKDYIITNISTYIFNPYFNASEGSLIRLISYLIPVGLVLLFYNKLTKNEHLVFLWSFIILILFIFLNFYISTFIDRISLYFIPIQIIAFLKLYTLNSSQLNKNIFYFIYSIYSFSFFYLWFAFSHYATYWHNYKNILTL